MFVKHLSQATCSETTYIQRGALHLGFTLEPDIVYNEKKYVARVSECSGHTWHSPSALGSLKAGKGRDACENEGDFVIAICAFEVVHCKEGQQVNCFHSTGH